MPSPWARSHQVFLADPADAHAHGLVDSRAHDIAVSTVRHARAVAEDSAEDCAHRELREEAGVTAGTWHHLGTYAITLNSPARISLYLAEGLTLGPQELTDAEADFKLSWWPLGDAITAATEGRFLLPGGPLALLLAERVITQRL